MVSFMQDTLVHIDGWMAKYSSMMATTTRSSIRPSLSRSKNNNQGLEWSVRCSKITLTLTSILRHGRFEPCDSDRYPLPKWGRMNAQFQRLTAKKVSEVEVPRWFEHERRCRYATNHQVEAGWRTLQLSRFRKDDEGDFEVGLVIARRSCPAIMHQIKDPNKLFTGSGLLGRVLLWSMLMFLLFLLTNGLGLVGSAGKRGEQWPSQKMGIGRAYDMYGGQEALVDFDAYKKKLYQMGLRWYNKGMRFWLHPAQFVKIRYHVEEK